MSLLVHRSAISLAAFALCCALVALSAGCDKGASEPKEEKKEVAACAGTFGEQKAGDAEVECMCAADKLSGSVWGTGVYTSDSSICAAALHAGAVKAEGGAVKVKATEGCNSYAGSEANGVNASSWGPWSDSFYFPGHGDGVCPNTCPSAYKTIGGLTEESQMSCKCGPEQTSGSVWGTGMYTRDSNLCAAAVHAGVIKAGEGGEITLKAAGGCDSYAGSEANGVTSSDWGAYGGSFFFPSQGEAKCFEGCPRAFNAIDGANESTELTCPCAPNPEGSVYGTGVYTTDSAICAAAVHAGLITAAEGGEVTVKAAPGCEKYEGTEANGVTTSSWGAYDGSFYFPAKGEPVCAQ